MIKNCILIFKFNKKEDDGIIKIKEIVSDYNCYYIIMDTQFNCDIYQYVIGVQYFDEKWIATLFKGILEIL